MPPPNDLFLKLQTLVIPAIPHLVFVKNREGTFHYGNTAMARFYGCDTPEELVGKTDEYFSPDDPLVAKFRADDIWVIDNKTPKLIPREQVKGFGSGSSAKELHWLSTIKLPLDYDGGTLAVGVSTFIDELVNQENALATLRRNQVWEVVARQVRHRIGNKLATFELIVNQMPSHFGGISDEMRNSVRNMKLLLNDFAKLQKAGDILKKSCSFRDILLRATDAFAREQHIAITINGSVIKEHNLPVWQIMADSLKLGECLHELMINSKRWVKSGTCKINIQVEYPTRSMGFGIFGVGPPSRFLVFTISDNGPGIDEKDKERIFFSDYTTHAEGTGLGLAIVKEIIQAHGGEIREVGSKGVGAVFRVELPI